MKTDAARQTEGQIKMGLGSWKQWTKQKIYWLFCGGDAP